MLVRLINLPTWLIIEGTINNCPHNINFPMQEVK